MNTSKKKTYTFRVRVDEKLYNKIEIEAKEFGYENTSSYIRHVLNNSKNNMNATPKQIKEEFDFINEINSLRLYTQELHTTILDTVPSYPKFNYENLDRGINNLWR